jgi:succinyl-CoA synthetase beta subunit
MISSRLGSAIIRRRTAAPVLGAVRNLNVHEHISLELMQRYGIKTPDFRVARTPDEAEDIFLNSLNKRK